MELEHLICGLGGNISTVYTVDHVDKEAFVKAAIAEFPEVEESGPWSAEDVTHTWYRFQRAPEDSEFCQVVVRVKGTTRGAVPVTELIVD